MFVENQALKPFVVNRSVQEEYQANGKGVNVSIILKKMGISNTALGFLGGFTGNYIEDELKRIGVDTDFIGIEGITRINTFVKVGREEYKIVNKGPTVLIEKSEEILGKINCMTSGDFLIVSGSTPQGVGEGIYLEIAKIAKRKGIQLILDISSKILLDCLAYNPYLIKPNDEELASFFNKEEVTDGDIVQLGKELLSMGSENVLISKGEKGATFLSKEKVLSVNSPKGKVVNTACAGDSLLAAFIGRLQLGDTIEEALVCASAIGASTAFTTGLSDLQDVSKLMEEIKITKL